jgi:hypothetical protein
MTISQTAATSFKVELLQALHNFGPTSPNTFKIALYTAAATLNADTLIYTSSDEVVGAGYVAGGNILNIVVPPTSGNNTLGIPTAYVSFAASTWQAASFTTRGALIYNSTNGNRAVAVLDFGADKTVVNDTFQVIFPTASANSAIVRIN